MTQSSRAEPPSTVQGFVIPVTATLTLFAAWFAFATGRLLQITDGHLTYALDDAYIHMAIAKNVALHGIWGVDADRFAAASSSPLWTLLLALSFRLGGVSDVIPLVLNAAFAVILIVVLGLMLARHGLHGLPLFALLASAVLVAPLVPMVWIGMEHTLHILLTLLTMWGVVSVVQRYSTRRMIAVCVWTALMVATRYEGLFVAAGCALVLARSRRLVAAISLTVAGSAPVVGVGLWNLSHGWFFLPSSIMMKQTVLPEMTHATLLASLVGNVMHAAAPPAFAAFLLGALVLAACQAWRSGFHGVHPFLVIFVTAALLHLPFAKFGWLFRYESYLMVMGAVSLGVVIAAWPQNSLGRARVMTPADAVVVLGFASILAASDRTIASNAQVANVAGHIYRQHRQVAALVGRYYDVEPVALNDIGVVSYYTRARVFDLVGLGSLPVATMRRAGLWDAAHMNVSLSNDRVDVAVIYDTWFQGSQAFHRQWERVGEWTTDREDVRSEGTVTFFARNPEAAVRLRTALREFESQLPATVVATLIFEPDNAPSADGR
jgi:hypothetical protein